MHKNHLEAVGGSVTVEDITEKCVSNRSSMVIIGLIKILQQPLTQHPNYRLLPL